MLTICTCIGMWILHKIDSDAEITVPIGFLVVADFSLFMMFILKMS